MGEDAALFDPSQQSLRSWGFFGVLLTGVLALLYPVGATLGWVAADNTVGAGRGGEDLG